MSVQNVIISDCLERVAPPEQVLRIGAVEDTAFVYIEKYDEDAKGTKTTIIAQIAVSLPALREALQLLRNDTEREDLRAKDKDGSLTTRIGGIRHAVMPL
jgi:hypothetical protein